MRNLKFLILTFIWICFLTPFNFKSSYGKDIDIGVSINDGKLSHFYFSVGDYYRVPVEKIIIIKKRYPFILEEEIPIIFLIHEYRGIEPDIIIQMRKKGYSWYDIMIYFGLYPDTLFRKYVVVYGPPYGKAWGYYKKHKREKIVIYDDRDIIELANIKFLTEYYHEDPKVIIEYKKKYPKYIEINEELFKKHKLHKNK
jgi:hypothetical protein